MQQKPENRAGGGLASPCPKAGATEARVAVRRTADRGRRKIGSLVAHNSLPPVDTAEDALLSPPVASVTGEGECEGHVEPLTTRTVAAVSTLPPEWCDTPAAGGKRRVFSADEKARIVAESFESGQSVCSVARRYRLRASQLFAWRKSARLRQENSERAAGIVPTGAAVDPCAAGSPALASQDAS
jgi:hypothetical protein